MTRHAANAAVAIQSNNAAAARRELHAILDQAPANVSARANLGMVEYVAGNYAEAARQFEAALSHSPSLWSARAFLGLCKARLGEATEATRLLERALPNVNDSTLKIQAGLQLVKLYTEGGKLDKAVPALAGLEAFAPKSPEVLYASYRLHSEIASATLRRLSAEEPNSPWLDEVLGQNYMAQEQYTAAAGKFRKAIAAGPQLTGLHYQLGEALFAAARTEENRAAAEKEFEAELRLNPGDSASLDKLGEIALERQDYAGARSFIKRALAERPLFSEAHASMAKILDHDGDVKGAISELEQASRLAPDEKTTHYRLAQLYRGQGRIADADRELGLFQRLSAADEAWRPQDPGKSSVAR